MSPPRDQPLRTLTELQRSGDAGSRLAIVLPGKVSFACLWQQVAGMAAQLQKLGIKREDVVSLSLINGLEFVISFLATTWIGAASAPLNPDYKTEEVLFYLEDTKCQHLIVHRGGGANAKEAAKRLSVSVSEIWTEAVSGNRDCDLQVVSAPLGATAQQAVRVLSQPRQTFTPSPDDIALILHTSGTTSRPKAVPLTHRNLCASTRNIANWYKLDPSHRALLVMPLFHVHGLIGCLLSTLHAGGSLAIPPKFSASTFWRDFNSFECNWYTAVPTIHQILLQRALNEAKEGKVDPKNSHVGAKGRLRFMRSCSSALPAPVFHDLEKVFGVPVVEAYAMTENAHQMTSNPLPPGARKPGSVGEPTGIQVAILDDEGKSVEQGKEGEVCIKGESVTPGYLNNPQANKDNFTKDGWFRTGDRGYLDTDGYVHLTGRIKELINRGGEKISPLEVDSALLGHPAVAEAICFGVPHPMYGQEVNAAIVLRMPVAQVSDEEQKKLEKEIQQFAGTKLAAFKVPKRIFFADTLPRTATGKIQRRNVAAHFLDPNLPSKL